MIIRISVGDNDFGELMEKYMKNIYFQVTDIFYNRKIDDESIDEWFKTQKKMNDIMNPNCDCELTENDKEVLIDRIYESFREFAYIRAKNSAQYLIENLQVSIINSFEDKWENGEAFYWLQHSGVVVNQ